MCPRLTSREKNKSCLGQISFLFWYCLLVLFTFFSDWLRVLFTLVQVVAWDVRRREWNDLYYK